MSQICRHRHLHRAAIAAGHAHCAKQALLMTYGDLAGLCISQSPDVLLEQNSYHIRAREALKSAE